METYIYINDGKNIETKLLNLGSALKYAKKQDDLIEQYDSNFESTNIDFINDKSIEEILKSNYFNYGIVPRELIIDLIPEQTQPFYLMTKIDPSLCPKLKTINLPETIIDKINVYIDTCHTYLDILFKNYQFLSSLEVKLSSKLDVYRNKYLNKNSYTYIEKLLFFNRIRNFINELKHEKIIDFQYFYSNLLIYKYYTLINEKDVLVLHEQLLVFDKVYQTCHESIEFLDENNEKKFYEIKDGSIKIDEIKMLLEKYIDSF